MLKLAILVFPGSNCEQDLAKILREYYLANVEFIWHTNSFNNNYDAYFLPGGFSYGDYLRSGALAKMSNSLESLKEAAAKGRLIIGICNGFQILTEVHLLPGALIKNCHLKHICKWVGLKSPPYSDLKLPKDFSLPISHSEGNYICSQQDFEKIAANEQIYLEYEKNPNGSFRDIAGIANKEKNIFGLMPHPERSFYTAADIPDSIKGSGKILLDYFLNRLDPMSA